MASTRGVSPDPGSLSAPAAGTYPRRGERFPCFALTDPAGRTVRVPDGPTMLIFLRGHWCEHCQAQLSELAREVGRFRRHRVRIVALSTDDAEACRAFSQQIGDAFPVLSDPEARLVRRLGLLDPAPELPGPTSYPAVFLIDASGRVQFYYVGRAPADRPTCELLLLAAERLSAQSQDEHAL